MKNRKKLVYWLDGEGVHRPRSGLGLSCATRVAGIGLPKGNGGMQRFPRAGQRLASSAKAEGTLATRSTRRAGMKVDLRDPMVLSVCHLDVGSSPPGAIVCPKEDLSLVQEDREGHTSGVPKALLSLSIYPWDGRAKAFEEQHQSIPNLVVKLYCGDDTVGEGTPRNKSNRDEVGPTAHRIRARGYEPRARGSNPSSPTTSQKGKDCFSLGIGKS
ncbi:hypothetical protein Gohar_020795 [Gossypium harknessii]|uniref:Uncharacterized protein n=1 Tax=Gossypium harknessii TaxID=34285 RepID=A0A7J9HYT1_9ROSI|nr:hypothetical protein [Gossypium harknessii]